MTDKEITRRKFVRDGGVAAAGVAVGLSTASAAPSKTRKTRSHHEEMEYRRLGKTNLRVSAVCLGGHWKRVNVMKQDFDANRHEIVSRCLDAGINFVDACCGPEILAYSKTLKGRRDKMYFGFSYAEKEVRKEEYRTTKKLMESFDGMLLRAKLEYCDVWRITCHEPGGRHAFNTACELVAALEKAKKQGKARFIGISSHDRRWLKMMIEYFPQIEVILTPYTAKSKVVRKHSLFDTVKKADVGVFGIKPFASNSLFKGNSSPDSPHREEDDRRARLAIRHILGNEAITAPIPGLISAHQVENVVTAVKERRRLDLSEAETLRRAADEAWAKLPREYEWLKKWEYV